MRKQNVQMLIGRVRNIGWVIVRSVLIIGLSFIIIYPIIMKISVAFKDPIDIYNINVIWIPQHFTLQNFRMMIELLDYWPTLFSTAMISLSVTAAQTLVCMLSGYAFAKLRFRGSNLLFACAIFTILVPAQTIMVPLYMQFKSFDIFGLFKLLTGHEGLYMLDSFWPLIISSLTGMGLKSGLFIYIFRQFFRGLPKELEESAYVDGAGVGRTFIHIAVPNSKPAIITVALFTFVWQWNDTFFSGMYLGNTGMLLSIKLGMMSPWINFMLTGTTNTIMADPFYKSMLQDVAILLTIMPLIVLYLFVQRHFVESIERTGLVG